MNATATPTPIPESTPSSPSSPSSPSCRRPFASVDSLPTAVLDPLWGRVTGDLADRPYRQAVPGAVPVGGQVQPTPASALWLMAAGRDCLRTSHAGRLMVEAASLRTVSETDRAVQAAWDSEGDDEVREAKPHARRSRSFPLRRRRDEGGGAL